MSSGLDFNPVEDPGHHYSVSSRIKKRMAARIKLLNSTLTQRGVADPAVPAYEAPVAVAPVQPMSTKKEVHWTPSIQNGSNKVNFLQSTKITPMRIGLERMGMAGNEETSITTHNLCSPTVGPPRANFWHDPSDPVFDITDKFCVVRVESPNKFWVQNLNQACEFRAMEADMTQWYNKFWAHEAEPMQPQDIIEGGFYAAYLPDYQQWARARVVEFVYGNRPANMEYIVHLLDYGSERMLTLENLYYLRQIYLKLPMQSAQMEIYYEGESRIFTPEESLQFKNDIGGEEIDVIVLSVRKEYDLVFPVVRGVFMKHPVKSTKQRLQPSDFYSLNGKLQVTQLIQDLTQFQDSQESI